MKVNKKRVLATIGALGLTAGVLAGCGKDKDYVKVVDSNGQVHYIDEDDYNHNSGFFILFASYNGHNNHNLRPVGGYHGKMFKSNPKVSSGAGKSTKSSTTKSGSSSTSKPTVNLGKSSGVGKSSSGSASGGFGG